MFKDFGYTIHPDRQIDYDHNSLAIVEYISISEPSFDTCISCGTCTAGCSTGQFTEFSIRRIIALLHRGETGDLKKEIAKCMFCGKCQLACPRGVNLRNLILTIHNCIENFGL